LKIFHLTIFLAPIFLVVAHSRGMDDDEGNSQDVSAVKPYKYESENVCLMSRPSIFNIINNYIWIADRQPAASASSF
jgi:hypothetical protein